jgi:hypothetical protein
MYLPSIPHDKSDTGALPEDYSAIFDRNPLVGAFNLVLSNDH